METTLDVLKRIESKINERMEAIEKYKDTKNDLLQTATTFERAGLLESLTFIWKEMDKITGLGQ